MNKTEFIEMIQMRLRKEFPDYEVVIQEVLKTNDTHLKGVMIRKKEDAMGMNVYLDKYYEEYTAGKDIDSIINQIKALFENNQSPDINVESLSRFDEIKEHIGMKLINTEKNTEFLKDVPHRQIMDLSIIYCVELKYSVDGIANFTLRNSHLDIYGTDEETLFQLALANAEKGNPVEIRSITEVLGNLVGEVFGAENYVPFYVLSNRKQYHAAAGLVYSNAIQEFAEQRDADVLILPSSVHELLLIPEKGDENLIEYKEMVTTVNCNEVSEEEFLSNHVYEYSRRSRKFKIVA